MCYYVLHILPAFWLASLELTKACIQVSYIYRGQTQGKGALGWEEVGAQQASGQGGGEEFKDKK